MIAWLMTLLKAWFFPKEEAKKIEQADAKRAEVVAAAHAEIEKKVEEQKARDSVDVANDIINGL